MWRADGSRTSGVDAVPRAASTRRWWMAAAWSPRRADRDAPRTWAHDHARCLVQPDHQGGPMFRSRGTARGSEQRDCRAVLPRRGAPVVASPMNEADLADARAARTASQVERIVSVYRAVTHRRGGGRSREPSGGRASCGGLRRTTVRWSSTPGPVEVGADCVKALGCPPSCAPTCGQCGPAGSVYRLASATNVDAPPDRRVVHGQWPTSGPVPTVISW